MMKADVCAFTDCDQTKISCAGNVRCEVQRCPIDLLVDIDANKDKIINKIIKLRVKKTLWWKIEMR